MATTQFGLLEEREEGELHKIRLLNVEEKPFKRVTKRLVAPGAFTNPSTTKLPTPPPENGSGSGNGGNAETQGENSNNNNNANTAQLSAADIESLKEDITLDFAAFDSAIARLQLLASANGAERERYAADRVRILGTMDGVRASNGQLRRDLEAARETLARRRRFDELADRIAANRMLRPRAEQRQNLRKLADECAELERESADYGATWRERRGQFGRLVDEGVRLRALIRDEKEEVERREGMDDNNQDDSSAANNAEDGSGSTTAAKSGNATPRPEHLLHQNHSHNHNQNHNQHHHASAGSGSLLGSVKGDGEGSATPRPGSRGDRTPRPDSPAAAGTGGDEGLKPRPDGSGGSFSRAGSQVSSARGGSRQPNQEEEGPEEGEDVEMGESASQQQQQQQQQPDTPMAGDEEAREDAGEAGASRETPQITVEGAEAAAAAGEGKDDTMDTT
ncbi:hypothetical protein SLS62_010010 [Diatrype stigma]|uniref:Tho complex subunit 7 n=1 Tax=Diatrype stigma TaxID=117547 RepID=A0AAN9UDS6_9PEZI